MNKHYYALIGFMLCFLNIFIGFSDNQLRNVIGLLCAFSGVFCIFYWVYLVSEKSST